MRVEYVKQTSKTLRSTLKARSYKSIQLSGQGCVKLHKPTLRLIQVETNNMIFPPITQGSSSHAHPPTRRPTPLRLRACTPLHFRRQSFRKKAIHSVRGMLRRFRTQFPRPEIMSVNPSEGLTVHYVRIIIDCYVKPDKNIFKPRTKEGDIPSPYI